MSTWSVQDLPNNGTVEQNFRITRSVNIQEIRVRIMFVGALNDGMTFKWELLNGSNIIGETDLQTSSQINELIQGNQLIDWVLPFNGVFLGSTGNEQEFTLRLTTTDYSYIDTPVGLGNGYIAILNRTIEDNNYTPRYGTVITEDTENSTAAESANFTPLWIEIIGEES